MSAHTSDKHPSIGSWALALGATGFAAGFFGPILLSPEANQGPLLGIFFTGPCGALAGLVLGTLFRGPRVSRAQAQRALLVSCAVLGLGTSVVSLPGPVAVAQIIDAKVTACTAPRHRVDAALEQWRRSAANAAHHTPPADWEQTALRNVREDGGVVAVVHISRRSIVQKHGKPWNHGRLTATPWTNVEETGSYYLRDPANCEAYLAQGRTLYQPFTDAEYRPGASVGTWPPTDVIGFLGLMELGPVAAKYRRLVGSSPARTGITFSPGPPIRQYATQ